MRVTGFYIDGFGIFHNCRLNSLSAGLNLFLGANEAGKSTLLAFFRQILFGFPTARNRHERQYFPQGGGRLGGILFVTLSNGKEIRIERRKGPRGGLVTLGGADGSLLPDMDLSSITGGMGMELYRNIYAFSLNELQTIESLDSADVKAVIYSAGMGTGLQRLPEAEKIISTRKSSLFKPRGKKTRINALIRELDMVTHRLNQAMEENRQFEQLCHTSDRLKEEIKRCKEELAEERIRKARLQTLLNLAEPWSQLKAVRKRIDSIRKEVGEFPEQGIIRLESMESRIEEANRQLQEYRAMLEDQRNELEALQPDTGLLSMKGNIQGLFHRLPVFTAATERLNTVRARVTTLQQQINALCLSLGEEWGVKRIESIDRSMFTRDAIIEFRDRLRAVEDVIKQLKHSKQEKTELLNQADRAVEQAKQRISEAESHVTVSRLEELEQEYSEACNINLHINTITDQIEKLCRKLNASLAKISALWDHEILRGFDLSEASASWIRHQDHSMHAAETELQRAEDRRSVIGERLKEAELDVKRVSSQMEEIKNSLSMLPFVQPGADDKKDGHDSTTGLPDPASLWGKISELQETLSRLSLLSEKLHHLQARLEEADTRLRQHTRAKPGGGPITAGAARFFFTASALFAAACPAVWYLSFLHTLMMKVPVEVVMAFLLILSALSLGAGLFELRRKREEINQRNTVFQQQLTHIQEERDRLASDADQTADQKRILSLKVRELLDTLGVHLDTDSTDPDQLDTLKSHAASLASDFQKFQRLHSQFHNLSKQLDHSRDNAYRLQTEFEHATAKAEQCRKTVQDQHSQWKKFLESNRLDESVTPSDMNAIVAMIHTCRGYLDEIDHLKGARHQAEERLRAFFTRMQEAKEITGLSDTEAGASLQKIKRFIERLSSKLRDLDLARQQLEAAETARQEASDSLGECIRRIDSATEEQTLILAQWEQWLEANGFERGFRPDTLLAALGVMEQVLEKQADLNQLQQELYTTERTVMEYHRKIKEIFLLLHRNPPAKGDVPHAVKLLNQDLDAALSMDSARNELEKDIKRLETRITTMSSRLEELENDLSELLSKAKVSNTEEFRHRYSRFIHLKELENRAENLNESINKIAAGHDLTELLLELDSKGVDTIKAAIQDAEDHIQELQKKIEEISAQTGRIKDRLSRLADSDELSGLMTEQERIRTEIADLCRRWSVLRVAEHMIDSAKSYFEREKQPQVITRAGQFFHTITQGRYAGILAPPGSREIFAVTADGERISPENLSRGTAEQLYLSLRFGYITCRQGAEEMPLLMDDILVNFDPERALATAEAVAKLSEEMQVIFLTCHPETVDIFRSAAMQNGHMMHLYQVQYGNISLIEKTQGLNLQGPDAQT